MNISIGVEGGGTLTRVLVHRGSGETEYFEQAHSIKVANGDFSSSARSLRALVVEALHGVNTPVGSMVVGLSGMSRERDQAALIAALRHEALFASASIRIISDAELALEASLETGTDGVLLISGTGSIAYARVDGEIHRFGGWGPAISDEGSGYWIGLQALKEYVREFDDRRVRGKLFDAIHRALPVPLRESPVLISRHLEREQRYPATLAQTVFEMRFESPQAESIISEAANALSGMIQAAISLMDDESPRRVVLQGSIAQHSTIVERMMQSLFDQKVEFRLLDKMAPVEKALQLATAAAAPLIAKSDI